jgi:hypothetical protein
MDKPDDVLTGIGFAAKHGLSRQWVCELLRAGRIAGAQRVGRIWLIPAGAPMPDYLSPGRVPSPDSARAVRKREQAAKREARIHAKREREARLRMSDAEYEQWLYDNPVHKG